MTPTSLAKMNTFISSKNALIAYVPKTNMALTAGVMPLLP